MFELVLGTHNAKKLIELRLLLPKDQVRLLSLADLPDTIDVDETGDTFTANAARKARKIKICSLSVSFNICISRMAKLPPW